MQEAERLKRRTVRLSILSNAILFLLKLLVGFSVGAVSIVSEAMHSGVDLLASFIAFLAIRKATTPPDRMHGYGHGKFENLSAMAEALLILLAAAGIIYEALEDFEKDDQLQGLEYAILVMAISILINTLVSRRLLSVAKQTDSQALAANGLHLQSDVWTSVGVLAGLALMRLTEWPWLDPVIAIMVAGIIFRTGWHMLLESLHSLTDASLPEEEKARIGEILSRCPEVKGFHCLRTRKSGSYRLLDVHVLFDGTMHLNQIHAICDELEQEIRGAFGPFDVLIHPEPAERHVIETNIAQYEHAQANPHQEI